MILILLVTGYLAFGTRLEAWTQIAIAGIVGVILGRVSGWAESWIMKEK